jgi:hypothetical protein
MIKRNEWEQKQRKRRAHNRSQYPVQPFAHGLRLTGLYTHKRGNTGPIHILQTQHERQENRRADRESCRNGRPDAWPGKC